MHDKILIIDFGSQVTQLIARRVREAQVYCEIHAKASLKFLNLNSRHSLLSFSCQALIGVWGVEWW